jgi:hypothetical protein
MGLLILETNNLALKAHKVLIVKLEKQELEPFIIRGYI